MKFLIIGLGNFGASLAEKLSVMGNEVIGVDKDLGQVEKIKDRITHSINLDATDEDAVDNLPLKDSDVVIISIGEDKGSSILCAALMKQKKVKRLLCRTVDPLQRLVLEAMDIQEVIQPEEETAERWAKKLNLEGVVDSFQIDKDFSIVETRIPKEYDGKTVEEIGIKKEFDIIILTTMKVNSEKNNIGAEKDASTVQGIAKAETILHEEDIMVLYGKNDDIKRLLEEHRKFKEGLN